MKKGDFKKILDRKIETENAQYNFEKIETIVSLEAAGALVISKHILTVKTMALNIWNILTELKKIGNFTINANIIQMKKIESQTKTLLYILLVVERMKGIDSPLNVEN